MADEDTDMVLDPAELKEIRDLMLMEAAARTIALTQTGPSCTGKFAFATQQQAQNGITQRMDGSVRAYRCHLCGKWHIGRHQPRLERNKRTRFLRGVIR